MKLKKSLYGMTKDGKEVFSFVITNDSGAFIELLSCGATLNKIVVPDRGGNFADVLVGFDTMAGQELCAGSQGRTVGRVANRISGEGLTIGGVNYQITKNVGGRFTLHGNHEFAKALWEPEILSDGSVRFSYFSPAGSEGFPANVCCCVTFEWTEDNAVMIYYYCRPDAGTALNVTNHAYFNLGGFASGDVLGHELQIFADAFTPMDEDSIPTGEIRPVEDTPFDFRMPKPIGRDIGADDEQLRIGGGYDHNFCLNGYTGGLREYAVVREPKSGRVMTCSTDLPGVQLYTGNYLDGSQRGKGGLPIAHRAGFCLETQYFPNALNTSGFIPCLFDAAHPFVSNSVYRFSAE